MKYFLKTFLPTDHGCLNSNVVQATEHVLPGALVEVHNPLEIVACKKKKKWRLAQQIHINARQTGDSIVGNPCNADDHISL